MTGHEQPPTAPASTTTWDRWGESDETGALNTVTPERTLAAVQLVRTGIAVSLSQPIGPKHKTTPHRSEYARFVTRGAGDYALGARSPGGFRFAEDVVQFATHSGTHADALSHAWRGDHLYNGFPAASLRTTRGAQKLGAEKLRPAMTRGVLIDFVATIGGGRGLPANMAIGVPELEAAIGDGPVPGPGDAVLLRTGWWESADPDDYYDNEPGLDEDAALWLADRDIALVGADNYAIEVQPSRPGTAFPVHLRLIHERGIPLIENMNLLPLAGQAREFAFVFAPLPLEGSTGAPLNPLAIL